MVLLLFFKIQNVMFNFICYLTSGLLCLSMRRQRCGQITNQLIKYVSMIIKDSSHLRRRKVLRRLYRKRACKSLIAAIRKLRMMTDSATFRNKTLVKPISLWEDTEQIERARCCGVFKVLRSRHILYLTAKLAKCFLNIIGFIILFLTGAVRTFSNTNTR